MCGEGVGKDTTELLWGGLGEERKTAWVKWSNVCLAKDKGGLGIRDISVFNKTLLGKWGWRLLAERGTFWVSDGSKIWVVAGRGEGES